jgi:hypothetical protein
MVHLTNLTPKAFPVDYSQWVSTPLYGDVPSAVNHRFWLQTSKTSQEQIKKVVAVVNGQKIAMKQANVGGLPPSKKDWYCDSPTRCTKSYDYLFIVEVTTSISPPITVEVWLPRKDAASYPKPFHASVSAWGKVSWFTPYNKPEIGDGNAEIINRSYRSFYVQNLSQDQVSLTFKVETQPTFSILHTYPPTLVPMFCGDYCIITVANNANSGARPQGKLILTATKTGSQQIVMLANIILEGNDVQ